MYKRTLEEYECEVLGAKRKKLHHLNDIQAAEAELPKLFSFQPSAAGTSAKLNLARKVRRRKVYSEQLRQKNAGATVGDYV